MIAIVKSSPTVFLKAHLWPSYFTIFTNGLLHLKVDFDTVCFADNAAIILKDINRLILVILKGILS